MPSYSATGKLALVFVAASAGLAVSACARLGAQSRVDPATIAVYPDADRRSRGTGSDDRRCPLQGGPHDFEKGAVNLDCFAFPEDLDPVDGSPTSLGYARAVENPRERNRLTALLLKHSDDVCTVELGRLNSNEATVNTSLSILTTALTSVANIVTGERASEILTGGATIASGSRDHVNVHVYRNQVAYAISRAIALERQSRREAIERRYEENTTKWTVDDAIRAANAYHQQCSFYKGLELLLASVENKGDLDRYLNARTRQNQLEELNRQIATDTALLKRVAEDKQAPILARIEAAQKKRLELLSAPVVVPEAEAPEAKPSDAPGDQPVGANDH